MNTNMSKDLRDYRKIIIEAVAKEREADPNWSWTTKAVNKTEARIGWGYLDYIGETTPFKIELWIDQDTERKEEDTMVIGAIPSGAKKYAWIGPHHWNDAETIEQGIRDVIHSMALYAHNRY